MLIATTDPLHLQRIAEMVGKVDEVDYTPKQFKVWLIKNFDHRDTKAYVDLNEAGEIESFVIAQVVKPLIDRELFIPIAYVKPNSNGLSKELWARIEGYARYKGAKKISLYTKGRIKSYRKKYGFKLEHFCLSKEVL